MDTVDGAANQNLLFPILPGLVETTVALIGSSVTVKEGESYWNSLHQGSPSLKF